MEAVIAEPDANPQRLATAYGVLGQLYHAYEFFDEANACYTNATILEPDNFVWYHFLGDVLRNQSKLEEAASTFGTAWALEPNDFSALVNIGEVYLDLGRERDAQTVFGRALSLNSSSPSVMAAMGQLALRRREYERAVVYFTSALAMVPEANRLHYGLAMAYRGLGRLQEARHHLEMRGTVGLRPPDPLLDGLDQLREGERVHLLRGRLAFGSKRYEEARDEFQKAVDADPKSARALVNLGTVLARLGDVEAATGRYLEALKIDPESTTAHFNLASLYASRDAYAAAQSHVRSAVEAAPQDSEAQLLLARTYAALGDYEASLAPFEQAALIDPSSAEAVVDGAAALVRLEHYYRAKRVLEAGLDRMPDNGVISFALARLLAAAPGADVRDGERALDLAKRVFAAENSPRHIQLVAQALAEAGKCDEAAQWQQKLIDLAIKDSVREEGIAVFRKDLELYSNRKPCRPPFTKQ
ncbi:MAG: tetratricopeptide repeat protein [bacterium]|nr:tetratricopeptide repeat protein [bacterium]